MPFCDSSRPYLYAVRIRWDGSTFTESNGISGQHVRTLSQVGNLITGDVQLADILLVHHW